MLAWTLALLAVPALASACTKSASANGDWNTPATWGGSDPSVIPSALDVVCIPAGVAVSLGADATVSDVHVDGVLAIAGGPTLTVGSGLGSTVTGTLSLDGSTLALDADLVDSGAISLANGGRLNVGVSRRLTLQNGVDILGTAANGDLVTVAGELRVDTSTAADPSSISAAIQNDGTVNAVTAAVLKGGATGAGFWGLGSGPDAGLTLDGGGDYVVDGEISDAASGGLGKLVIGAATLTMTTSTGHVTVHELDMQGATSTVDYGPLPVGSAGVDAAHITVRGGLFEVDAPVKAQSIVERDGEMLCNGTWTTNSFHWGGGKITAGSAHNGSVTTGVLDMTVDAASGDSGQRQTVGPDLTVTGDSSAVPYSSGTFDLAGGSDLTIGTGGYFVIAGDVDIAQSSLSGKIVNHGRFEKSAAAGASVVSPQLDMPDGTLYATQGTLTLAQAPVQYDAGTSSLTAGSWILTSTLQFPGPITSLGAGVQFAGANAHLEDSTGGANTDALTTITSNAAGNTFALSGSAELNVPAASDFTNDGTVSLSGNAAITVQAGQRYIQATSGAVTNLKGPGAALNVSAPGFVDLQRGTLSGIGAIFGDLTNSGGTLAPGNSPGTLTINGNFTQNGTGILAEEIDGSAAGQFDKLVVGGTATLGGSLVIQSTNGYQAPNGTAFDSITAAAVTGAFAGIVQSPTWPWMDPSYSATTFRLTANSVSVNDAIVAEGNSGSTAATFTISLGRAAPTAVAVDWATQDGSAVAGSDYAAASGTVSFAPGETTKTVTVQVTGDTAVEPDENFAVNLSNPVGTRILRAAGVGTITNDDSPQAGAAGAGDPVPPGDIDGFAIAPPPIQGKAVNVAPVSGRVLVKLPRATKFVPLPDEEQVPVGTIVDATRGTVRLFSAGKNGRVQSALFYEGVFQVTQKPGQALTTLKLVGGSFAGCPRASKAVAARKKKSASKSVRHLWGSGSGQFQTVGRYASAAIRGTKWLTDDRCNGTLIRVAQGAVTVRDLTLKKSFALKAPKQYLAPAAKPKKRG